MADEAPVKRGPGRPRKVVQEEPAKPDVKSDPDDPRIGQECDPSWNGVGFEDGYYRCENGVIVEKMF